MISSVKGSVLIFFTVGINSFDFLLLLGRKVHFSEQVYILIKITMSLLTKYKLNMRKTNACIR